MVKDTCMFLVLKYLMYFNSSRTIPNNNRNNNSEIEGL